MTRSGPAAALALALAAAPAVAQDLSGQFAGAVRAFTLPGTASLAFSDLADDAAILEVLPRLEGDWAPLHVLFPDLGSFDADLVAGFCERTPTTLARTAERSFEMRRSSQQAGETRTMAVRFDWMMGNSFDRGVAEAEIVPFMGLDAMESLPPAAMAFPNLRGPAQLFQPASDVLVIVAPAQFIEIWGRCPG